MSKLIQSVGYLNVLLGTLAGPLMKVAVFLAIKVLIPLAAMTSAFAIDRAIQRTEG